MTICDIDQNIYKHWSTYKDSHAEAYAVWQELNQDKFKESRSTWEPQLGAQP